MSKDLITRSIRLDLIAYAKLSVIAENENRSINGEMVHAISQYSDDYEKLNTDIVKGGN